MDDPIVQELHNSRKRHAEKFDNDLRRVFEDTKSRQVESGHKIISRPVKRNVRSAGQ
jgi:hypothetical protein